MRRYIYERVAQFTLNLLNTPFREGQYITSREDARRMYTRDTSNFISINGHEIHYQDEGEGFPILLLHGFGASLHVWDMWAEKLREIFRVVRLDFAGFGLSTIGEIPEKASIKDYIDLVKKFCEQLRIEKMYIVGNSMGGWTAWELAVAHPEMIEKMVLVNAAGYFSGGGKPLPIELMKLPVFKKIAKTGTPKFAIRQIIKHSFADPSKLPEEVVDTYYHLGNLQENMLNMMRMATVEVAVMPEHVAEVKTPTLILWGDKDRVLPVQEAYLFERDIKGSKLIVYKNVGHVPMIEAAEQSYADLMEFLGPDHLQ